MFFDQALGALLRPCSWLAWAKFKGSLPRNSKDEYLVSDQALGALLRPSLHVYVRSILQLAGLGYRRNHSAAASKPNQLTKTKGN